MKRNGILVGILILLLGGGIAMAQKFPEKGLPLLDNFTPEQYGQAGKVWAIKSAPNGLVYFASNKGLLEFDGEKWHRFSGSKGFSRSLLVVGDSLWYTGADKDFGRWQRTVHQQLSYQSLYPFRESAKGLNEEFWGVYQLEEDIVFVSFNNIYIRKGDHLTKIAAPYRFAKSFQTSSGLYLADEKYGLYHFDGLNLEPVFSYPSGESWQIMGLAQRKDGLLIVTRNQGLFLFQSGKLSTLSNAVNQYLSRDQVFSFTPIEDSHYAFGTILNGVYITDLDGKIIQHLNKQKGLPNNTILSMHYSPRGTLWLSMDYGISALRLSSRLSYVLDHQGSFGTGQTAIIQDDIFYLGTNQGLYRTSWQKGLKNDTDGISFELLPLSAGQVWTLQHLHGTTWLGHDRGLFRVEGGQLIPVATEEGVLAITSLDDQHLLTGNYNGVSLFQRQGNNWLFVRKLKPIQGACNQLLVQKDQVLWVNIPNYGLIKASLDNNFNITQQRIFPAGQFQGEFPTLFQDSSGILLRTNQQQYRYQQTQDSFVVSSSISTHPPVSHILPESHLGQHLNDTFDFYPVYNGFALFNKTSATPKVTQPALLVRELSAFNNDTTRHFSSEDFLPYRLNNISVHFRVPQQQQLIYRYKLVNYQDQWSNWSTQTQQNFLHLPEGDYELKIEARTDDGQLLQAEPQYFTISPPWYRKWYAYLAYGLGIFGIFYLQRLRHNAKLARQKAQHQAQERRALQQQAEAFEQAKLIQRHQSLEAEIAGLQKQLRAKTIELAKKAKENEDKNRLLQALKKKIDAVEVRSTEAKVRWAEMSRLLEAKQPLEDHTFEMQMDELHQDFLRQLKARYPKLTTYDLRLATYLKTGLSSREIADIMNVLPSSVNVSRSRLRKKLELDSDEDLYEFLNGVDQA